LEHIERGGRIVGWQTVGEANPTSTKFLFGADHILFGKLRPNLGKVARPDFDGICSTDILPIRPGDRLDRGYLHSYLAQPQMVEFAASRATGANLPRLSPRVLETFDIPVPPLDEQRRIAAILDRADALRAKRRQAAAWLDGASEAIFIETFADHDFPDRRLRELADGGDRINYGVVQPGEHVDGGVPVIRVSDLRGGLVNRSRLKRISPDIEHRYARSRIRGNEILLSCVGSVGVISLASADDIGSNVVRAVARVPISDAILRTYVAAVLRSPRVQRYFVNELRTVSQPTLNIKQIGETSVPVPPRQLLCEFASRLHTARELRRSFDRAAAGLALLTSSIQGRAFRGQL
jgi:type I restriction enzyme S subunit